MGNLLITRFFTVLRQRISSPSLFSLFGLMWMMLRFAYELLECWKRSFHCHRTSIVWPAVPLCVMWNLWYKRNKRVFDGLERPTFLFKEHTLFSLYDWMSALVGIPSIFFFLSLLILFIFDLYFLKRACTHLNMCVCVCTAPKNYIVTSWKLPFTTIRILSV